MIFYAVIISIAWVVVGPVARKLELPLEGKEVGNQARELLIILRRWEVRPGNSCDNIKEVGS